MKRYMMTLLMAAMTIGNLFAMDYETARERAYYLTDKMAYELNLNDEQYSAAYEINLDYLLSLNSASDLQAEYLAYRNADLRHILYDWQWKAFTVIDYLFRPVWWLNGAWHFPVFGHYAHNYYFYHRPAIYWDYRGGHGRIHFASGYYHGRRPAWHGGLRGMNRDLIGHPNPHGGRYGDPRHPRIEHRGGHTGRGYHFDRNFGNNDHGSRPDMGGSRPETGHGRPDIGNSHPETGNNSRPDVGNSRPKTGSHNGFNRGNSNGFSRGNNGGFSRENSNSFSRGSAHSGTRSNFSGSRSGGFSSSRGNGFSGSRGGGFSSPRGGGGEHRGGRR